MLNSKILKKLIPILLVMNLIYANFSMAISGMISYAIDETEIAQINSNQSENEAKLEISLTEFCKDNMREQETEYEENINLKLNYSKSINEVIINDISTIIGNSAVIEDEKQESEIIKTFYKTTKIQKNELIELVGEDGYLEIDCTVEEIENVEQKLSEEVYNENLIILPEENNIGTVTAKEGRTVINSDTISDEEGYITIIYPERTKKINIKISGNINKTEKLQIKNNKIIEKIENIEEINLIQETKQIIIKGESELLNTLEMTEMPINYSRTFTELGIDKTKISTSVENEVNFTITMHTDKEIYNLYKNPYFVIELPNKINTISVNTLAILNNPYFTIKNIEESVLENGNKAIILELEGEQTEQTKSSEENIQIVIGATIKTEEIMPTEQGEVKLYYKNEIANSYETAENQGNGLNVVNIEFVSNKDIIVESKAIAGEQIVSSPKEIYNTINIKPNTYNVLTILGKAINNTGSDIANAKILGKASNIGKISGVENVYYTENENATIDLTDENNKWSREYSTNSKKYLIIIENFKQAQTVEYAYLMSLTQNIENDITHEANFEVYDTNNQIVQTSKVIINQKAEKVVATEEGQVTVNIEAYNELKTSEGERATAHVIITNSTAENLENISLQIDTTERLELSAYSVMVDENIIDVKTQIENNVMTISGINIESGKIVDVTIGALLKQAIQEKEIINAKVIYQNNEITISDYIDVALKSNSKIETNVTSNKINKELEKDEKIEYKLTVKNSGDSKVNININAPELKNIYIRKIKIVDIETGKIQEMKSTNLSVELTNISLNVGETNEIYVEGQVKDIKTQEVEEMYFNITGDRINDTITEKLTNRIKGTIKENNKIKIQSSMYNTITGIAWIDKNENGQKEDNETLLKGVQAVLVDTKTSAQVDKTTTNNKGEYSFTNIPDGTYIIEFKYNTNTFDITEYKNEFSNNDSNSAVINTTQDNKTTAKTEVINLTEGKTENINAGFVVNKNFDISINKGITKVTVNNEEGTKPYEFDSTSMAKVEIEGKYLKGSIVLVEYEIAITNVGEVEGYAKLISDIIPEGMKFNSELNTDWYEENNGKLYTSSLANKKLQPGETAILKLILTKEMDEDKIVTTENTANIEELYNDYLIEDKNINNNVSKATIIISLTTGQYTNYLWLMVVTISIIILGLFITIKISKTNNAIKIERRK